MIIVNLPEAKTRLSDLVEAVADRGETVTICREGKTAALLIAAPSQKQRRDLIKPDPRLQVVFAPGYEPAEPLSAEEWPDESR